MRGQKNHELQQEDHVRGGYWSRSGRYVFRQPLSFPSSPSSRGLRAVLMASQAAAVRLTRDPGAVTAAALHAEDYFDKIRVFERRETAGGDMVGRIAPERHADWTLKTKLGSTMPSGGPTCRCTRGLSRRTSTGRRRSPASFRPRRHRASRNGIRTRPSMGLSREWPRPGGITNRHRPALTSAQDQRPRCGHVLLGLALRLWPVRAPPRTAPVRRELLCHARDRPIPGSQHHGRGRLAAPAGAAQRRLEPLAADAPPERPPSGTSTGGGRRTLTR